MTTTGGSVMPCCSRTGGPVKGEDAVSVDHQFHVALGVEVQVGPVDGEPHVGHLVVGGRTWRVWTEPAGS